MRARYHHILLGLFSIAAALSLASCDIYPQSEQAVIITPPSGLTVSPATVELFGGDFLELTASVTPAEGTSKYFHWTTSDKSIATVDNFGLVEAFSPGKATITVTTDDGTQKATCVVTVKPTPVSGVSLDKTEATVYETESVTLVATVAPEKATDKTVKWTSDNPEVATVDKDGKVTGISKGTARITVTTNDGGKTATCVVTVAVRIPTEPEQLDLWRNDKAGYRAILGGSASQDDDWLHYADGVVTWDENTSGSPRTKEMTFPTGSTIKVTQVAGKDFVGTWTMQSRLFNPNAAVPGKPKGTTGADKSTVTISAISGDPEVLDGHENAFELSGLYLAATMKVAFDIDYDAKTVKMGLFFDKRSTQLAKDGVYCAYVPELEGSKWGSYNFAPSTFGKDDCYYEWMWCNMEDFKTFRYLPHSQNIIRGTSNLMLIGISIQVSTSADPSSLPGGNNTSYNTIYQANYNVSDTEGLSFHK